MRRAIVGFRRDEADDPVALLDCCHAQHVRHRPPFINRPWAATDEGLAAMVGKELDCPLCDRLEWPDGLVSYRHTPTFDERTTPLALTRRHATKRGVWGRIHIVAGTLDYVVEEPVGRSFRLAAGTTGIICPEVEHRVAPMGPVRFRLEFYRSAAPP